MTLQWAHNQSKCVHCDDTSIACHHTRSQIHLHPGWFLEPSAWQQPTVAPKPVPCPFEPTCVGGTEPGSLCINGSTGPLCGICAPGFYRDRHSCSVCPDSYSSTATTVALVSLVCLAVVGLLYCYLHSVAVAAIGAAVAREQSNAVGQLLQQASDIATWPPFVSHADWPTHRRPFISYAESGAGTAKLSVPPKVPPAATRESSGFSWSALCRSCLGFPSRTGRRLLPASWPRVLGTLVKILLGYTQMLYVFTMLQAVHWPTSFESFMHHVDITMIIGVQAWIDKLLLPYDCIVKNIDAYQLLVMTLLMPPACSALISLVSMLAWCTTARRRRPLNELNKRLKMLTALGPGIWHLHVWLMLMLYPSLCREALSIFLCTGVDILDANGNTTTMVYYLNQDTNEECGGPDGPQWYIFSLIAGGVGILGYALGLPALALLLTRRYQLSKSRAERVWTGRRISLLLSSYIDDCYWFESADLLRKFLLTGVVLNVAPGSNVQIWFGLIVSVAATVLTLKWSPYRDWLCGWVQAAATLQIMVSRP